MPMFISAVKNRKHRPHPSLTDWQNRLSAACGILHELAEGTEGEFIRLGEKLQDFYFRAKTLSDLSSQVAGCLSGETLQQSMNGLQTIFTQVQQQDELSGKGIAVLSSLLNRFNHIKTRMERFDQTIRNLDVLCNFIKIESARLGSKDTGFSALGDEVRKLALNVAAKSAELTAHSEKLAAMIRQGLQRMRDFEKQQQGRARTILDQTVQSLSVMTRQHQSSSKTLEEIATRWKRMSQSIGEVVASMQFHDITRQRIEHVRDALQDVKEKLRPAASTPEPHDRISHLVTHWRHLMQFHHKEIIPALSSAVIPCEVQSIQLKDAETDMTAAVERIIRNLTQIGDELAVMTEDLQTLTVSGAKNEESFLSGIEKRLSSLADAIAAYRAMNREWAASVQTITSLAGNMSVFIRDIEKIGIQMQMIALNACIHAAHIGQEGAALGTLAESIRQLSDETSKKIEQISTDLKAVMTEAGTFTGTSETEELIRNNPVTASISHSELSDPSRQIDSMIAPLHQMDQEVSDLLRQIHLDGSTLTQDIETTVEGIDVHHSISAKVREVTATLEAMVAEAKQFCPTASPETTPGLATEMAERYTMEREREIHQSIAGGAAAAAVAGTVSANIADAPASVNNSDEPEIFSDILFDDEKTVESTDDILFDENLTILDTDTAPFTETPVSTAADAPPDTASPEDDLGDNIELF